MLLLKEINKVLKRCKCEAYAPSSIGQKYLRNVERSLNKKEAPRSLDIERLMSDVKNVIDGNEIAVRNVSREIQRMSEVFALQASEQQVSGIAENSQEEKPRKDGFLHMLFPQRGRKENGDENDDRDIKRAA